MGVAKAAVSVTVSAAAEAPAAVKAAMVLVLCATGLWTWVSAKDQELPPCVPTVHILSGPAYLNCSPGPPVIP